MKYTKEDRKRIKEIKAKAKKGQDAYVDILAMSYQSGAYCKKNEKKALKLFMKNAASGSSIGLYRLGYLYLRGELVKKDINLGIKYLKESEELNSIYALLELADYYYNRAEEVNEENDKKTFYYYNKLEKRLPNSGLVNSRLGVCYKYGIGVDKDDIIAIDYFKKSINEALSKYHMSLYHYYGKYVDKDDKKAFDYMKSSFDNGRIDSAFQYGYYLYNGIGTAVDKAKAFNIFSRCNEEKAKKNFPLYFYYMGLCYYYGHGTNIDYKKAYEYFLEGSNRDIYECYMYLGFIYYEGNGATKNYRAAFDYFKKALDHGYTLSYHYLGLIYQKGYGVPKDEIKGFQMFKEGAEKGNDECVKDLARCYYNGTGCEHNIEKCYELIKDATDDYSEYIKASCYLYGSESIKNINEGLQLFEKLANNNNYSAAKTLGNLYCNGTFVKQNDKKALEFYNKAANGLDADVLNNLYLLYTQSKDTSIVNYNLGYKYAKLSADNSNISGIANLLCCYINGYGVEKDLDVATKLLKDNIKTYNKIIFMYYCLFCVIGKIDFKTIFDVFNMHKDKLTRKEMNGITQYYVYNNYKFNVYQNGTIMYLEYKGDLQNGYSLVKYNTNSYFKGKMKNNKIIDGKWNYWYANGDHYQGYFVNGKINGEGILFYKDGNQYEGNFKDGRFDGEGKFWFNNGDFYKGSFKDGYRDGYGTYIFKDGSYKEGLFVKNDSSRTTYHSNEPTYSYSNSIIDDDDDYSNNNNDDDYDYDYDSYDDDDSYSCYTTLVDDYGNETEINNITGRDSDGNLWESDGPFSDTYHMVDEDDDD